ncbi:36307_t:CDS:2 [Gigaspora margarita]|uniref:36307_t:CDS:1 n=1 Tax=Gigaspora margarita TaxID=4874 RepID=A0ABN7WEF6_GIGMA|nr:36307_t:CDS:2 [Gigaspora margarita]
MCSGPIQGLADSELEKWLKTETKTQSKALYDINSEQGYAPFAIYNDIQNGYINIIVFTPSITSKKDLEIIHTEHFMTHHQSYFSNKIDEDCKAKVTINNGVTLISLKSKNSKRRIMIK